MNSYVLGFAACLASASPARATVVLATVDFEKKAVQVTHGDLTVRLSAGPTRESGGASSLAEIVSPRGKLTMILEGQESPVVQARIVRLAFGDEPQVLFQRAATGSAACVESKLAVFLDGAWRALDLDRVCEMEDGYEVADIDGDGLGELISKVDYFDVFEDHPHQARAPIRIQRVVGGRVVVATGARRFRDYLRKSLLGGADTPPEPEPSIGGTANYTGPAAWMATKALLGETREGWAAMAKAFGDDRQSFEVCAVRLVADRCPPRRALSRPFLAALALLLVADNYVKSPAELPLP